MSQRSVWTVTANWLTTARLNSLTISPILDGHSFIMIWCFKGPFRWYFPQRIVWNMLPMLAIRLEDLLSLYIHGHLYVESFSARGRWYMISCMGFLTQERLGHFGSGSLYLVHVSKTQRFINPIILWNTLYLMARPAECTHGRLLYPLLALSTKPPLQTGL